ncbi:MAG: hypothetical protein FJZ89_01645 [Chloroflexi bacterium]|nr:hypothetical protein [Chloroflexota bacterium]
MRLANVTRLGFGLLYLLGALFNTMLAASYPQGYLEVANSALLPVYKDLWRVVVAPHLPVLLVLLILFEFSIGVLILSKGLGVKLGLLGGLLFNLFLVPLQFVGGMPNLLLAAIQAYLLTKDYRTTILELFRRRSP